MVVLPKEFVATRYPGYFWNTEEHKLYSIKIDGVLKPIKFDRGGVFGHVVVEPGYRISVGGIRKKLTLEYLHKLKQTDELQVIPKKGN